MQNVQGLELKEGTQEEVLPGFGSDFPYIATCAELDKYIEPWVPWHWHRTVELFYMKSGRLEYTTPKGKWTFPAGSGGMVNSNVLHTSRIQPSGEHNIQLLHLFDPSFLSGEHGSRMEAKYILPLTAASSVELIALYPDDPAQARILEEIRQAFELSEKEWGYEFQVREKMTQIWLELFEIARPSMGKEKNGNHADEKLKKMMVYIHEHFAEPIVAEQLAQAAHISKRACFRLFRENLHITPVEYLRNYRLEKACQMLAKSGESVTQIAYVCGLGTSSYFGKIFRKEIGCSPSQYRRYWHDRDIFRHP